MSTSSKVKSRSRIFCSSSGLASAMFCKINCSVSESLRRKIAASTARPSIASVAEPVRMRVNFSRIEVLTVCKISGLMVLSRARRSTMSFFSASFKPVI